MASSDDIKNSLDDIASKIDTLSTDLGNTKTVLQDISNHLMVSNIAHSRNARANDISWKLSANSQQVTKLQEKNEDSQLEKNAIIVNPDY